MTGERELSPEETHLAFAPLRELRPHVATVDELVERVNHAQRPEGYRLVASFDGAEAVSAAGFRRLHTLAWGDVVYLDDLVTMESFRGRGHAHRLLDWVLSEARRLGCAAVQLDSAPHRHAAHRLYLAEGYVISSFHFSRRSESWAPRRSSVPRGGTQNAGCVREPVSRLLAFLSSRPWN